MLKLETCIEIYFSKNEKVGNKVQTNYSVI